MFDLYALIINLSANNQGVLAGSQGQLAHAAFHRILDAVDPALAQTVHDYSGRKPFTISQLHGFGKHRKGSLSIRRGQQGYLRVTLTDATVFQAFIAYFLGSARQATIRLNAVEFSIHSIVSSPEQHALAGYTSRAQLHEIWQSADLTSEHQQIALHFRSPTYFSVRGKPYRAFHLFPSPEFVFEQLAKIWDQLTGQQSAEAVTHYVQEWVICTRHDIHTSVYKLRNQPQVGFCGDVHYAIKDSQNKAFIGHLNLLADLAFFTGVGSKTTHGMGQVQRLLL